MTKSTMIVSWTTAFALALQGEVCLDWAGQIPKYFLQDICAQLARVKDT